ncbi:USP34_5 [Blepharisma stoltei]|uniref:ubiquitinyl hydrolase 1 n=1 Tax=Blepharisma stoltei TaxID=1481888 RepID=A0AAU9IN18_9CILI|nr:unnamed protein product [Blepharisma stoltei]
MAGQSLEKSFYRLGGFIDARDTMNIWCVTKVIEISPNESSLKVRYDGWSDKWDVTFPVSSNKIAPFRKFSRNYTGQKKQAIRYWNFSQQEVEEMDKQLKDLMQGSLRTGDPYETTQFLRGRMFTLVDCLLTHTYKNKSVEPYIAMSYFTTVIDYIVLWMKNAKDLFPLYYEGIANPGLFLTDDAVALAMAWPELLCTLGRIFGLDERTNKYMKTYSFWPKDYEPTSEITTKGSGNLCLLYVLNYFAKIGGFQTILGLLNEQDEKKKMPFEFIQNLPVYELFSYFSKGFADEWVQNFKDLLLGVRLESMTPRDIKDLDKEVISDILIKFRRLMNEFDRKNDYWDLIEMAELDIAVKCLKSPYFEKRIKGLNEIKDMAERVMQRGVFVQGYSKGTRYLTPSLMSEWLIREKIIEQVLDYSHIEMIKRVSDLLIFLSKSDALKQEHLELLWSSAQNKHDSLVIATYQTIVEIAPFIKKDFHLFLYDKMKTKPVYEYDERYLKVLKDFTIRAMDFAYKARIEVDEFAVPIFYDLLLDTSPLAFNDLATDCISEIIRIPACKDKLWSGLEFCIKNLEEGHSIPQSLKLSMSILDNFSIYKVSANSKEEQLKKLDSKVDGLIKLIISSFENYIAQATNIAETRQVTEKEILIGKYSHKENIKKRIEFLEYVLSSKSFTLTIEDFAKLWLFLVKNPVTPKDKKMFFKWLQKVCRDIFQSKLAEIFEDFFCNPEQLIPETITIEAYQCFQKLFLVVNANERNIETRGITLQLRTNVNLIGLSALMEILLKAQDPQIITQTTYLVVNLNMRLGKQLFARKEEIWVSFVDSCLRYIDDNKNNSEIIKRILKILMTFLEDSASKDEPTNGNTMLYYAKAANETDYKKVYINSGLTLGFLRRKLAELYKKHSQSIVMNIGNVRYDSYDDDLPLTSLKATLVVVDFVQPKKDEITPIQLLAKHQQVLDTLFQLLSQPDQDYVDQAWALLTSLPINERIINQLNELTLPLPQLLDHNSVYKLLYCLLIIEKLVKDEKWAEKFIDVGGVVYLISIYMEIEVPIGKNPTLALKFNSVVVNLLQEFFSLSTDAPTPQIIGKVLDSLLLVATAAQNDEDQITIARNANKLICLLGEKDANLCIETIKNHQKMPQLVHDALLICKNKLFTSTMMNLLLELSVHHPQISEFILELMLGVLDAAFEHPEMSEHYWNLLAHMVREAALTEKLRESNQKLISVLTQKMPEKSSKDIDNILCGILKVLKVGIKKFEGDINTDLVYLVLHSCLFEIPTNNHLAENIPPKCKSPESRKEAFMLLLQLCFSSEEALIQTMRYLNKLHEDPHWRTGKIADWNYSPNAHEKSETGFVGIKNLGSTCYMNSSIQQLFNIPSFRDGILRAQDKSGNPPEDSLLYQLQSIFAGLLYSDKQHINPKAFCGAFKDWEGKPVNLHEQMDADEFFNNFMDRLENQLKGDTYEHIVKNHFGGLNTTEMIGKVTCTHKSERDEPFLTLPVQVRTKKNLYESLESFTEGEVLEGDNAYQCDHCEAKVTALRRVCIKHLPNILIISMRRFEFDFDTMSRIKVNDYCEFPLELDMEPYTQEGLERKEIIKEKEQAKNENKEFTKEIPNRKYPDEYYKFTLKGIVIHMGTAESGHYYSFIKDRKSGRWFEFNDTVVREFDPEDIPNEAFGGEEKWSYSSSSFSSSSTTNNREKYRNAYLLIYERSNAYAIKNSSEDPLISLSLDRHDGEIKEFHEVKDENERYWRCKSSFSPEYCDFVLKLLKIGRPDILKFSLGFFLTIMIRSKEILFLPSFVNMLKEQLKNDPEVSEWLLELVSLKETCRELLMDCPVNEKRRIIAGIIHSAIKSVSALVQENFLKRLLNRLYLAKKPQSKNFSQYFEVIYRLTKFNSDVIHSTQLMSRLLSHILDEKVLYPDFPESYIHNDIFLGYDKYAVIDDESRSDRIGSSIGSSFAYLLATLQLGTSSLPPTDIDKLMEKNSMVKLAVEGQNKIGSRAVGQLYATICIHNLAASCQYINILLTFIREYDFDAFRPYMRQLTWMLKLPDSIQVDRVDYILKSFNEIMKDNKNYYRATETCIDYLFKIMTRIQPVREWVLRKYKDIKWIEVWLKDSQYPTASGMGRSPISIYKPRTQNWSTSNYTPKNLADKVEFFKKVMKGSIPDRSAEWDSDGEIDEECLQEGKKLDAIDIAGQKWTKATIVQSMGELIYLRYDGYGEKTSRWVDSQSETIAPEGSKVIKTNSLYG